MQTRFFKDLRCFEQKKRLLVENSFWVLDGTREGILYLEFSVFSPFIPFPSSFSIAEPHSFPLIGLVATEKNFSMITSSSSLASMFKQSKERYKLNSFFLVLWRGNKTRFLIKFYNNLKLCFEEGNIAFLLERRYSKITF